MVFLTGKEHSTMPLLQRRLKYTYGGTTSDPYDSSLSIGTSRSLYQENTDAHNYAWQNNGTDLFQINMPYEGISHGTSDKQRKSDRIYAYSLTLRVHLDFSKYLKGPSDYTGQLPFDAKDFIKCRVMCIEFDSYTYYNYDPVSLNTSDTFKNVVKWWFRQTRLPYDQRTFNQTTQLMDYQKSVYDSVSVHSDMLRVTTKWNGHYRILYDKKLTLTGRQTRVNLNMNIPLKRTILYDDSGNQAQPLLGPYITWVIIPPLNADYDVSPRLKTLFETEHSTTGAKINLIDRASYWYKFTFMDLEM